MATKPGTVTNLLNRINNGQKRRLYLEDFFYSYKCSKISAQKKLEAKEKDQCVDVKVSSNLKGGVEGSGGGGDADVKPVVDNLVLVDGKPPK